MTAAQKRDRPIYRKSGTDPLLGGTVFCTGQGMVHPPLHVVLRAAVAAAALSLAPSAESTLYKWTDQNGNVTYSNVLPPESAQVRDIETIDETRSPTATEARTRQILEEAARERRALGVPDPALAPPTTARGGRAANLDSDLSGVRYEWVPDTARQGVRASLPDSATLRYPPATPVTVRDPCLLSADPRCYELNAGNYDPYLGYAPAHGVIAPAASGATGGEGEGTTGASTVPSPQSSSFPLRNGAADTLTANVVPAAPASSPAPRGFRGLPPGTPVLPISR